MSDHMQNEQEKTLSALTADYSTLIHIDSIVDDTGSQQGTVADGGSTDDLQPTLNGRLAGAEGLEVRVFLNGSVVGYTQVNTDGNWSFTLSQPLVEGTENSFQVTLIDPTNGNTIWLSNPYVINTTAPDQDATLPDAPVISNVIDDVPGGITGALHNGDTTNDACPVLSGNAEAGATVNIYDNGQLIGSALTAADGSWAFTPTTDLTEGEHNLTATAVNAAGESVSTDAFAITVDTHIDAPVMTAIVDNVGNNQGDVSDGGKTDDTQPLLIGTGEPGSTINITMYGPVSGRIHSIATLTVGEDGAWSYQFTGRQSLQSGDNVFHITTTDAAGNTTTGEDFTVQLTGNNQDATLPDAPVISNVIDDVPGGITGALHNGDTTNDACPVLSGNAETGATVNIYDNGQLIGSALTAADGSWAFTPTTDLTEGEHNLTATAVNAAGESVSTDAFAITVDTHIDAPVMTAIVDNVGNNQGDVSDGGKTDDTQPLLIGTGEPGSTINITMYGPVSGRIHSIATLTVGEDGAWSYQFTGRQSLQSGDNVFHITTTDAAGNTTTGEDFTVQLTGNNQDATLPDAATNVILTDNVAGGIRGELHSGDVTNDNHAVLSGYATVGDIVIISDNGQEIGTATVGDNGAWSFTPESALEEGQHSFTTVVQNASGNESEASATINVEVDTAISAPSFSVDSTGSPNSPLLTGVDAEPYAVIKIYDYGICTGSVQANENGHWSFRTYLTSTKTNYLTALQTDVAGNVSEKSPIHIYVPPDLTPPDAPHIDSIQDMVRDLDGAGIRYAGATIDDTTPYVMGNAESSSIVKIYDGNVLVGSTRASSSGLWTAEVRVLSDGHHTLTATATDTAGNVSGRSNSFEFNIVTAAPHSMALASEHDSVAEHSLSYSSGSDVRLESSESHNALPSLMTLAQAAPDIHSQQSAVVDMTDHAQDTLQITLNDILNEAHDNLFIQDSHKQLAVTIDEGNVVELKVEDLVNNAWQDAGQVTAGGVQYEVYQPAGSDVELLVQQGVELHLVS